MYALCAQYGGVPAVCGLLDVADTRIAMQARSVCVCVLCVIWDKKAHAHAHAHACTRKCTYPRTDLRPTLTHSLASVHAHAHAHIQALDALKALLKCGEDSNGLLKVAVGS